MIHKLLSHTLVYLSINLKVSKLYLPSFIAPAHKMFHVGQCPMKKYWLGKSKKTILIIDMGASSDLIQLNICWIKANYIKANSY